MTAFDLQGELAGTGVRVQAVLPAGAATEFYEKAGIPLSAFDPAVVMATENLVDAALAGFDWGEEITFPSVHDAGLWSDYEQAKLHCSNQRRLASRRRVTRKAIIARTAP